MDHSDTDQSVSLMMTTTTTSQMRTFVQTVWL